jgi:hypothetical protein
MAYFYHPANAHIQAVHEGGQKLQQLAKSIANIPPMQLYEPPGTGNAYLTVEEQLAAYQRMVEKAP